MSSTSSEIELGKGYAPKHTVVDRVFVESGIDASVLIKATEGYQDWVVAVDEAIWNELDAGATRVFVKLERVNRHRLDLKVYGNGTGISNDGLPAIVKLMDSPSSRDPNKRGRVGSGSKAFCQHACALTVETVRQGEGSMLHLTYSTEELIELLNATRRVPWQVSEIPAGHEIRGQGTCFTWHDVGGSGISHQTRTAERIIKELHRFLRSDQLRRVTVIDEKGKSHKVEERHLLGQKIEGSSEIEGIGMVTYELAITDELQDLETVRVWAHDPVSILIEFLERIKPTSANVALMNGIRAILCHPQVIGTIAIPSWGEYVIRGYGAGFLQHLYDDDDAIFVFLRWLHDHLCPKVQAILGVNNTRPPSDDETVVAELIRGWQKTGSAPTTTTPELDVSRETLKTSPMRLILEPGDSIWIEVEKAVNSTTYKWNDASSGGTVSARSGERIRFTAGQEVGQYKLLLTSGSETREIIVEIVERLLPAFTQTLKNGEPDQRVTHKITQTKHVVGEITWNFKKAGGSHQVSSDSFSAVHQLDHESGTYEVWAEAKLDDGSTWCKKVTVMVSPRATPPEPKPERPSDRSFIYNDRLYTLRIVRLTGTAGTRDAYYLRDAASEACAVTLNFAHATFEGIDAIRMHAANMVLAQCIAANEIRRDPSIPEDQILRRMLQRSAEIFADRASAS